MNRPSLFSAGFIHIQQLIFMLLIRGPSVVASNGTTPPVWSAKPIHYTQVVKVQVQQFMLCVCWMLFKVTRLKTPGKLMSKSCKQTNDDGRKMMILPRCQVANHSVFFSVSTRYLISEYVLFSLCYDYDMLVHDDFQSSSYFAWVGLICSVAFGTQGGGIVKNT